MRNSPADLATFLDNLKRDAQPGDRLPTIRDLMRRFGTSQMVVQRAFNGLKAHGEIASEVGRGTFFTSSTNVGTPVAAKKSGVNAALGTPEMFNGVTPKVRSILLLRRSISLARGRVLAEGLQQKFAADGHRVLDVSYNDPEHARTVLKGLPHFDACVIQSTFKSITIELLAALRATSDVLAVDGAALVGADVEAVGMEWGEPLARAVAHLRIHGHRRIAYASTSHPFLATQLGQRRFEYLRTTLADVELRQITVPQLPDREYETALAQLIENDLDSSGCLPYTALVAWGIEDGAKFRSLLTNIGLSIPSRLSVVILGRTDLANEHANFFDTIGCNVSDQIESLHQVINARWAAPTSAYGIRLIPVTERKGESIARPSEIAIPSRSAKARPKR